MMTIRPISPAEWNARFNPADQSTPAQRVRAAAPHGLPRWPVWSFPQSRNWATTNWTTPTCGRRRRAKAQRVKITEPEHATGQAAAQFRDGLAAPLPPRLTGAHRGGISFRKIRHGGGGGVDRQPIVRHLRRRVDLIGLSESAAEFVAGGVHAVDASEDGAEASKNLRLVALCRAG